MFTNVLYSTLQSTVTPRNLQYLLPPRRLATLLVGYYSRIASQPASLLSDGSLGGGRWCWPHPPWGFLLFSSREAEDPSHIPPTTHGNIARGGEPLYHSLYFQVLYNERNKTVQIVPLTLHSTFTSAQ